jgi:hypothetical protein
MTVFRNEGRWDTSNVLFNANQVVRYDKRSPTEDMRYIDYGLASFQRTRSQAAVPRKHLILRNFIARLPPRGSSRDSRSRVVFTKSDASSPRRG